MYDFHFRHREGGRGFTGRHFSLVRTLKTPFSLSSDTSAAFISRMRQHFQSYPDRCSCDERTVSQPHKIGMQPPRQSNAVRGILLFVLALVKVVLRAVHAIGLSTSSQYPWACQYNGIQTAKDPMDFLGTSLASAHGNMLVVVRKL